MNGAQPNTIVRNKESPLIQRDTSQSMFTNSKNFTITGGQFNNIGHDYVSSSSAALTYPRTNLAEVIAGVGASHNSQSQFPRGRCLPGTRELVTKAIHNWRASTDSSRPICWLSGPAGVGKSAIAQTIAEDCDRHALVASFFFFRSDPQRNNPAFLMPMIAYGLTITRPDVRRLIHRRVSSDPRILNSTLNDQFRQLIFNPLVRRANCRERILNSIIRPLFPFRSPDRPTLVIIDGLDECGDSDVQRHLLSILQSAYSSISSAQFPLRFLICSRPESWIREAFDDAQLDRWTRRVVLDDSFHPNDDIRHYLRHSFERIRTSPKYAQVEFPSPWPSNDVIHSLTHKACGQFIYVSTAVKFVQDEFSHPVEQLRTILDYSHRSHGDSPFQELDALYHIIVSANLDQKNLVAILAAIYLLPPHASPSPKFIERLLGLPAGQVAITLRAMHSVLDIRGPNSVIRVFHTSFTDFLFDRKRSESYFINKQIQHEYLSCRWLQVLLETWGQSSPSTPSKSDRSNDVYAQVFWRGWVGFCFALGEPGEQALIHLDELYRQILLTNHHHDKLLLIVASTIVLLPHVSPTPRLIEMLLGLPEGKVVQTLRDMRPLLDFRGPDNGISVLHPSFVKFICDSSRSREFFVDITAHRNSLVYGWLSVLVERSSGDDSSLWKQWIDFCLGGEGGTGEELFDVLQTGLKNLLTKSISFLLGVTHMTTTTHKHSRAIAVERWDHLRTTLSCFERVPIWLTSQGKQHDPLYRQFESLATWDHFHLTIEPLVAQDFITWMILNIARCRYDCSSTRRVDLAINNYLQNLSSNNSRAIVITTLCNCPPDVLDSLSVATPLSPPSATTCDYHVNVRAGCSRTLQVFVDNLRSSGNLELKAVASNVLESDLLRRRGFLPAPFFAELDHNYHKILSIGPEPHKMTFLIAAFILLSPYGLASPVFVGLLLGTPASRISYGLGTMYSVLESHGRDDEEFVFHPSFVDYVCDQLRSKEFYIDKAKHHGYLARRWIRVLVEQCKTSTASFSQGSLLWLLWDKWAQFCVGLQEPNERLLLGLENMDIDLLLSVAIMLSMQHLSTQALDPAPCDPYRNPRQLEHWAHWRSMFRSFETITSWLRSMTGTTTVLNIVLHRFSQVQTCFHIHLSPDVKADLFSRWLILNIADYKWECFLTTRVDRYVREVCSDVLHSIAVETSCTCTNLEHGTNIGRALEIIQSPSTRVNHYHINVRAGCFWAVKELINSRTLGDIVPITSTALEVTDRELGGVISNILGSTLLNRCGVHHKLLSLCRSVTSAARGLYSERQWRMSASERERIIAWLDSYPSQRAKEVGIIKNNLMAIPTEGEKTLN
ncbi:hypothetical protein PM082_024307 [Marasmius tenuissimus]|nr:hypothetical protein PM082_024307 [Marasmius tenuissimus]